MTSAFVRDFPQKLKVEVVKTKLSCETSLKNKAEDDISRSDPKKQGRPVTHGPDPFLSTLKRTILMNAVQTKQLSQTVVGSWHLEVKIGQKLLAKYKLVLDPSADGLCGRSELKGIERVQGKLEGQTLTFEQHGHGVVYHCKCKVTHDQQLINGTWFSDASTPLRGTFTGVRKGRVPFVDAGGTEWDPLTDFVRAVGTLQMNERLFVSKTKPMSMKDFDPLIKALRDILVGQDAATSFKMEEEVSASLADPFVLQFLVDNLIQQVVTSTPANGEDLTPEASYLLVMLYAAAQFGCAKDGGRRLKTRTWTTGMLLNLGLRVDNLAVALQLYRSEGDLRQTNFKEYMDSLKTCALGVKQKYVDRAMTTLRLLLAVLTSSALQQKKVGHFRECLALATEWRALTNQPKLCKPQKMVDWIDRLLVDWMLNTVKADPRFPTIQWALREPLFEYVGTLAMQDWRGDPGVGYALTLIYKDVYFGWANAREEFRFIRDKVFAGKCFKNALHDWSKDIAGIYAPLLINKEYLHQYYEECGLAAACRVPDEERRPLPPPAEPEAPAPQDDPDKLTMHRKTLEAVDSVLGLRVAQTVHEYCKHAVVDLSITMQEAASQVIEMLTKNYAGTPWICNLAAGWIAQLKSKDNDEDVTACSTLRKCIAQRMVSHFDQERADKLTNRSQPNPSVPWLDGFIKEWRKAIYELANERRSSRFVSGLLVQIAEADKNFDEVMKLNSTSESFQLFIRKMRELILRVLTVTNVDETLIKDDLDAFCDAATHKQYTYIYSQGILRGLISMCPLQRQPLQCLSEVLTDYHKSNHAVLRVDLRLSPVGQYPELSQLLHSMCRFGGTPHFDAKDVESLCKQGTKRKPQEVLERPKKGRQNTQGKNKRKKPEEDFSPSKKKKDSDSDAKTEVASDACSWGGRDARGTPVPKTPATKASAKKKKEDSPGASEGDASNSQQQTDRTEVVTDRTEVVFLTDSIWHWPAPSAVAASDRDVRDDFDPTKGLRGILETLRSKVFFEALLTRFVDPSSNLKMTPAQINSYARLMALCCHDGLLADANSESRRTAQKAVLASTKELEAIHLCILDPLLSWFRKTPKIAKLQQTALGCAAGLRWVQHVVLSDRLPQQQLLTRLAQPVIYQMLKSAWTAHPKKPTAGRILMIARQILESFTTTANSVASQEQEDDEPWEPMSSAPGLHLGLLGVLGNPERANRDSKQRWGDLHWELASPLPQPVGFTIPKPRFEELRKRACRNISSLLVFVANSAQLHVQVAVRGTTIPAALCGPRAMTGNGQAWLMAGKENQDRSRWPDVPVPPPPGLGVVRRAEQIHPEPRKSCKHNKIQDWSETSTLSEASVEVEPAKAIRPPPGLELVRLSDREMASLWQQWPLTDDSPGGGCGSTAETGASEAATQQPTEAEDQSEPPNSDAHSEKNFPDDALENGEHGDHDTAQDQVIDHQEPLSREETIPQEVEEVKEAEEVEELEAQEAVPEDEEDDVEGVPEEQDVPCEEVEEVKEAEAVPEDEEDDVEDVPEEQDDEEDDVEDVPEEQDVPCEEVSRDEGPRGDAKKKKKKAAKKGSSGNGRNSRPVAVPRSRVRPPKNQKLEEDTKEIWQRTSRTLGPAALFLVILLVVAAGVLMAPRRKETPRGRDSARSSLPEYCTAEIPPNVEVIPEGRVLPEPPTMGVLPRISLYSPCLWNNYGKAAKIWAPSALWSWKKRRQGELEVLEIQHPHERPLHILNVSGSSLKQRGQIFKTVTRNIFPKFGELNEETYGWYQAQYSTGMVVMLPDPEAHITLVKAQAQWRSTFEGLAHEYAPRYRMVYASTLDATAREVRISSGSLAEINEYTKKLEFLAGLWPPEHLSHLAARAAMMCKGSAFKRVMRIDPPKLKVNSTEGVKLLVTTLGGIWGKSNLEEKFERFERAIYTTVQRQDEAHESYLARHDFHFEELLQMGVGISEVRAYVLLRNSGLGSEDKKEMIVDAQGNLEYKNIVSALKLLGSKFFHEMVSTQKKQEEFRTMSFAQLAEMRIAFGESKINERFIDVVENDPKYVQWFTRKYADSKKATHLPFLYFIELYVERMELEKGIGEEENPEKKKMLMATTKSKAAARKPIDLESPRSWSAESDPSKPWSHHVLLNQVIHAELTSQNDRISNMEASLGQIAQQLQSLMQLTVQQRAPTSQ
eukprot:s570_g20.t1